ncbi:hypothetical protein JKF63_05861 [Porcisia hertigi]|uniref:ELMO domain-containing protein n=1 Tax=Porcisia hertigi TaxID=2761500 RepID=A0A836IX81_9TRYP|nr:hypothetical protein JKF63_05861 [Porcisia hertigi]
MRQRKGAPVSAAQSTFSLHTPAPVDISDSVCSAQQNSAMDVRGDSHQAADTATAGVETNLVQRRADQLEETNNSLCYWSQLIWLKAMRVMPRGLIRCLAPSLPPHYEVMLSRIRERYGYPYSAERECDVELLGRLWNGHNRVMFAPDALAFSAETHSVSDRWKAMGFQGPDPSTDFRGAGIFGLVQLVYLVERYPQQWSEILTHDFLAAAAGLNVTLRLSTLLGINFSFNQFSASILSTYSACEARVQLCRFIFDSNSDVSVQRLCEVYCFTMRLLHYRWMRSTRNIMEFNQLLDKVYAELERLLYFSSTLEDLCSRL